MSHKHEIKGSHNNHAPQYENFYLNLIQGIKIFHLGLS